MPIYKGTQQITTLKQGTTTISNVYKGTVPVFSNAVLPYRVNIVGDGIMNNYEICTNTTNPMFPYSYFCVDATSNAGKTWYGIWLNHTAFVQMAETVSDPAATIGSYSCTMSKTAWHSFISLYIGYDVRNTDFSTFTIDNTFYALDLDDWDFSGSNPEPIDQNTTKCWKFVSNGNNYNISYVYLNSTDLTLIGTVFLFGGKVQPITLCALGWNTSGAFGIDEAKLLLSNNVTFNYTYNDMTLEYLTNNGTRVNTTTIQSNTNNFSFSINSMFNDFKNEIIALNWKPVLISTSNIKILSIASYIAPQYNVPGTLTTELVSLMPQNQGE